MTQPFDDKDVVYRFTVSEEERRKTGKAEEYLVVKHPMWPVGYLFYARVEDAYATDEVFACRVIAHLLEERDKYKAALEKYADEGLWSRVEIGHGIFEQLADRWGPYENGFTLAQEAFNKKED